MSDEYTKIKSMDGKREFLSLHCEKGDMNINENTKNVLTVELGELSVDISPVQVCALESYINAWRINRSIRKKPNWSY